MSMKIDKMQVGVWAFVVLVIIVLAAFVRLRRYPLPENTILASVTKVVDRPNQAEDGYYGITVQTGSGQEYTIDATGYLNTSLSPESQGEYCVDVPKVQVGDNVVFNLPKAEGRDSIFVICYNRKVPYHAHFFRVE